MPYLIDGHNLIQAMPGISLEDPHDEAKLVGALRGLMIGQGKKCTVIFDGGLPGGSSRLSCNRVEVVFASSGQEADSRIINRIRNMRNASGWVLVSSDGRIREAAKRRKMAMLYAHKFAQLLEPKPARPNENEAHDSPLSDSDLQDWLHAFGEDC